MNTIEEQKTDDLLNVLKIFRQCNGMDLSGTLKKKIDNLRIELLGTPVKYNQKAIARKIADEYDMIINKDGKLTEKDAEILHSALVVALE